MRSSLAIRAKRELSEHVGNVLRVIEVPQRLQRCVALRSGAGAGEKFAELCIDFRIADRILRVPFRIADFLYVLCAGRKSNLDAPSRAFRIARRNCRVFADLYFLDRKSTRLNSSHT